jgi:hypothetical protein
MNLEFERHQDPKDAMGVGLKATSLRILSVLSGPIGNSVTDESVHKLFESLASGHIDDVNWSLAERFRYAVEITSTTDSFNPGYVFISQLSGRSLEFRGEYYQMPKFNRENEL